MSIQVKRFILGALAPVLLTPICVSANDGLSKAEYDWLMSEVVIPAPVVQKAPVIKPIRKKNFTPPKLPKTKAVYSGNRQNTMSRRLPLGVVKQLQKANVNANGMSAFVLRVGDRHPMLVYNENNPRVPASVMKLVTTYAALGTLGPNYRWPTEVYMSGHLRGGTLNGNLIIKGHGAPDLKTADLRIMLRKIRSQGIRNLNGNVVIDNSYFQLPNIDPGAFDGKPYETYNAQPEALLFNDKTSEFVVQNINGKPNIYTSTPAANVRVVNQIQSVRSRCRGRARSPGMSVKPEVGGHVVTFSGRFSTRCGKRTYKKAITDSSNMLYATLVRYWKHDVGGKVNARLVSGRVPGNARLLYRHMSAPLKQLIKEVNKESHNLMARQIMLTMGAHKSGMPSTPRKSEQAIKQWLTSKGLDFPELRIENGSGLSRWSRISARHIGELLLHAYRSPHRHLLMGSLAVAGLDGTMKTRLKNTPVAGRGRFKTGTLKDTRAIAGYIRGYDGSDYIVSILHNDPSARRRGKKAHDALIQWAYWRGKPPQKLAKK